MNNTTRVTANAAPTGRACQAWDTAAVVTAETVPGAGRRMRFDTQQVLFHGADGLPRRGSW